MVQYVKPDPDKPTPEAAAIEAYNLIDAGHFTDVQKNVLNGIVQATTGYVRAGTKSDAAGNPTAEPEEGATDGKRKPEPKAANKKQAPFDPNGSGGDAPPTGE